ncbi:MAG: aspartate dehydrogenase domain-containing protein [Leucobacter sp.]
MTLAARGRPQASSCDTLADAACELFLEQGYDATTVADITQRAGVSRSTFFNYFDGKAATLWYALDDYLGRVASEPTALEGFLGSVATDLGNSPPHTLALAISNADIMGVLPELSTGRALRQSELARLVALHMRDTESLSADITGAAYAAAIFAAIWSWAERGAGTHRLGSIIEASLSVAKATIQLPARNSLRVTVIGVGAIGARVIRELAGGHVPGAHLAGVVTRSDGALTDILEATDGVPLSIDFGSDIDRAIAASDLIVECAGISAARDYGPRIIDAGKDFVVVSVGALADPHIRVALGSGPGRLRLSTGAIGGLDLLRAASRPKGISDGITRVSLTSTKRAETLVQPWMKEAESSALRDCTEPQVLFEGSVAAAVAKFPGSLNVACALAAATGLWETTLVRLIADPHVTRTTHLVEASGSAGTYRFEIANEVSPLNPTSSLVVAEAVLSEIASIAMWS